MRKIIVASNETLEKGRKIGDNEWEHVVDKVRVTVIQRNGEVITAYPSRIQ